MQLEQVKRRAKLNKRTKQEKDSCNLIKSKIKQKDGKRT
jgi:hypothetical protein